MRKLVVAVAFIGSMLLIAAPVAAQAPTMTIGPEGKIIASGRTVIIEVTWSCASGEEAIEAFAYVTQDGHQSRFAGFPATCDGTLHTHRLRVHATDFEFHRGAARGSGYLLTSSGQSVSPGQEMQLR